MATSQGIQRACHPINHLDEVADIQKLEAHRRFRHLDEISHRWEGEAWTFIQHINDQLNDTFPPTNEANRIVSSDISWLGPLVDLFSSGVRRPRKRNARSCQPSEV